MSANQSNLSDPHYGYDLVVAVTQKSVNTTLKQFLAGLNSPEVILCFVYDPNNNLVPIDYKTLVANAKGSDPFVIPNGADPKTNADLINLANVNFAGAVKAKIGLPSAPLNNIPPIAVLGHGAAAPAQFNLLCSEFQISGFQYGARGMSNWINMSQSSSTQKFWYFSANVELNKNTVDPNSPVPPAVQQRIIQLQNDPANAFTIQKLFLDLDTAILLSTPTIEGLPSGWAVWNLISTVFLGAYFKQLRQTGDPVLSYSFTVIAPRPATMQLGSVSRESLPMLDNGQPINNPTPAQLDATQLVYIGSATTTPPIPVPFSWNWVDLSDVTNFSGVLAVRRDVFFSFFINLLNNDIAPLCIDTDISFSYSGTKFKINFSSARSQSPNHFQPVSVIQPPGTDGFTTMATVSYSHIKHNHLEMPLDFSDLTGDFNYTMSGAIAVLGNQIKIRLQAVGYMYFGHGETVFAHYTDLVGANYYDKTLTVLYTFVVNQNGQLQVSETHEVTDNSVKWNFVPAGLLGLVGAENEVKGGLTAMEQNLTSVIDNGFQNYVAQLTAEINGFQGWVFPGNDAFTFKNVRFSTGLDLIAQLTYVNPN